MAFIGLTACLVLGGLALLQSLLVGLQVWEHRRFVRSRLEGLRHRRPRGRAALVVPCKGVDLGLEENLHALMRQDYGDYEVTFVLESEEDPAYEVVQRVAAARPRVDWGILIAGRADRAGQKVHNLLAATARLPGDVEYLAFVDSDARPHPYWLRGLIAGLEARQVGAVTGYRWFVPRRASLANHLLYAINCGYAQLLGKHTPNHVWGGSWAIRREVFGRLGIRQAWEGTLSDDLVASRVIRKAGLRIDFEPACMVASPAEKTFWEVLSFLRRQYVIARHYVPGGWLSAFSLVWFAVLVRAGLVAALVWGAVGGGFSAWVPAAILAVLYLAGAYRGWVRQDAARCYFPNLVSDLRGARRFDIWGGPLAGLVHVLVLASSVWGRTITWRGVRYRLRRGGQIREVRRRDGREGKRGDGGREEEPRRPTRPLRRYRRAG